VYIGIHVKYTLFLSDSNETWTFSIDFRKTIKYQLDVFSDRASWIDYTLITNLMHWLLFIHKILFSSTCFEHQVLIFSRIQLYTRSIWYCHSLWEFLVACINHQLLCTDYYLFIKYYFPLHVSSLKCPFSGGYNCILAAYGTVTICGGLSVHSTHTQTVYRQATRNSHREWQYHMLHVYNCILLKMSTWGSKPVEENSILWINNDQCIKLVINIYSYKYQISWKSIQGERSCSVRTDGQTWRSY